MPANSAKDYDQPLEWDPPPFTAVSHGPGETGNDRYWGATSSAPPPRRAHRGGGDGAGRRRREQGSRRGPAARAAARAALRRAADPGGHPEPRCCLRHRGAHADRGLHRHRGRGGGDHRPVLAPHQQHPVGGGARLAARRGDGQPDRPAVPVPGPLQGWVVDWIRFPHWPTFNIADAAIACGTLLVAVLAARGTAALDVHPARGEADREPGPTPGPRLVPVPVKPGPGPVPGPAGPP